MHMHGVYIPENNKPLQNLRRAQWYVERQRDSMNDYEKTRVLLARPRKRPESR